ncbi:hypothetical protein J437_LFUL010842 [Ladona fulva]|uniref:Nuclear pore complex protein Nup153 n=1 Tax=Ladona fulva TaxID=123851 RepID=A0A8K0KC18_LADFU|nr:hypothetical protein J437_LFUL010842 [Ladona fulva]
MFKNKNQVDLHVQNIFKRCNNDTERNMRCYHFAKLYKEVGDYESARRFIVRYLTAREDSADAHKLYGHILLGLKQKKKALAEFKCSLELDRYQYELLPKVCHILAELDEPLDLDRAQYWVDRTKPHFPNNSAVFRLRERIISDREKQNKTNSSYQGVDELEALIAAELAVRPGDVPLRVRLLQLYLRANRVNDAFSHATLTEAKGAFRNDLQWYECLADVFEKASQEKKNDWEFVAGNLNVLERLSALSLEEYRVVDNGITRRSNVDCAKILQNFDKALHSASQLEFASSEREFFHEFLKHMRGQLVLHLATLIFRKVKEPSSWRKASKAAGALLLLAVGFGGDAPPDPQPPWAIKLSDVRRKEVARWAVETSFRVSQAGHILLGLSRDRGLHFMEQIGQFCTGAWREQVYQIAMGTLYEKEGEKDSHFLQFQNFAHPTLEIPSITDILPHDEMAQKLHPGSLHHMVWLGLETTNCAAPVNKRLFQIPPDFSCIVFEGLSLGNNLGGGPESISQLDVDAFLYATIYSSASVQEEWSNGTKIDQQLPLCLPAALTDPLCSPAQAQWWSTAYQLLTGQLLSKSERKDDSKTDVGERRLTLQRGLEVIRAVGNHGLGPELSVKLARTFVKRAKILSTSSTTSSNEVRALEERANLYWAAALPILERMARSQAVHYPQKRLFEYRGKPLSNAEVVSLLDEAHLAMAVKMMMEGKDEEAINAFLLLKVPEASYYLALIYKKLAAQEANGQAMDEITPETKSRQIALYTKAKECLHLTQERLRSTEYDRTHPIAIGVGKELEDLEIKFDKLNDSTWVDPDQTVISSLLAEDILEESQREKSWSLRKNWPSSTGNGVLNDNRVHSTPVRNTPNRMGNGISARNISMEESHQSFNETVKMLKDLKLWLADEMSSMKTGMSEIKDQVVAVKEDLAKLKTSRHQAHHTSEIPRQAREGRDAEEDIYVYGDEDEYGEGEEVNIAAAAAASAAAAAAAAAVAAQTQSDKYGTYPGTGYPYQGYPTYRQMSGVQGAATVTYGAPSAPAQAPPPAALLPPSIAPFFPLAGAPVDPSLLPPNAAGMYHSSLRYYGQGALPFSEGQQLPDFRGDARNLSGVPLRPPLIAPGMGVHPDVDRGTPPYHSLGADPSYMMDKHMSGPPPPLPENVVITSSDTLPTSVPSNQPPLSVVIPPRHRLGTPASPAQPAKLSSDAMTLATSAVTTSTTIAAAPHAFQISMPPQAQIPTQPPLDKTVSAIPPVETDKLLSSVPSPVHSAVSGDKTTPKASRTSTSPKARKSLGEEDDEAGEADDSVEHDPCPDFQPVIPLPAVVETHTGEEEETLLFSSRCKLYRFMEREWKERGIGIIKILHNQTTGKARIIMRREQVFKVCANHFITPDMSLSPVAGAKGLAWLWVANDFADEEVKLEKLSARFKTSAEAEGFKEAFEKAKKIVAEAKPDKTSSEGEKGDKEKVIGVGVPTSGYQKITSSGVGSQKVTSSTVEPEKVTKTPLKVKEASVISTPAEKQKVVLEGFTFVSPPTLKQVDDDKKKEEDKKNAAKPNIFASFSFGQTPAPPTGGITWGKPTLGISSTLDSSAKESSKPAKIGDQPEKPVDSEKKDMAAFKIDSTTKATETPTKPTFGSLISPKGGDGEDGEFMPTAEFKPVIPLPQLVEVKTGEEGEEILFEHRAKLLRFANKEWIEFGIGQMKITLNPSTAKVRLIMRREQVLKVCCNHFLTEDMQFMSLKTSDRCWTWYAQDYADGTLTPKTLAIKFKGAEEAARFKQVIDDLQKNMVDGKAKVDKTTKDKAPESSDNSCKGNVEKLFELFKPEAGSWECKECYIRNKGDTKSCVACSTVRPGFVDNSAKEDEKSSFSPFKFGITPQATPSSQVQAPTPAFSIGSQPTFAPSQTAGFKFGSSSTSDTPKPSSFVASAETPKAAAPQTKKTEGMPSLSSLFKPEEGTWECSSCYVRNKKDVTKCSSCCAQKPGTVATTDVPKSQAPQTTFTFGIPSSKSDLKTDVADGLKSQAPQATFTFGIPTSTSDSKKAEPSDTQKGLVPQATYSFGIPTSTSDIKKADSAKDAAVISKPSEGFGSLAAAFKPEEGSWECKSCYVYNKKDVMKCRACGELKPGQSAVISMPSEGFGSLAAEGSWECKSCYVRNKKDVMKCSACGELKPGQSAVTTSQTIAPPAFRFGVQPDSSAESKPAAATTAFTFCTSTVPTAGKAAGDSWAPAKFTFGASQPSTGATASSATPLFGQPLTSFTFGATTTGSKPTEEKKVADPVTGFTFNSNQKYEFHFKGVDPKINALGSSPSSKGSYFKSPDRQISHDESGGSDLYQEEDDGDHIHFQPVIPLPDKVPLHTGEENEEILYQHRAKLYRWNDKEWKERGCGDIKLLKHLEDGRVRMLMRREQVLKICLNHYVTEELSLTPKGDRAWQWTAVDFSEGEGTPELFSVRFKSAEIAESFREAFDEAKACLGKPSEKREGEKTPTPRTPTNTPQVGYPINKSPAMQAFSFKLGSEATPPSTTASRFSLESLFGSASSTPKTPASETKSTGSTPKSEASPEVEVVFERKTSEEDRQAALKLMLPPNFFAYCDKPPCPGCMGCENYDQEKLDRFFARNVKSTTKVEKDGKEDSEGKSKEESTSSTTVTSTTTSDSSASVVQKLEQPEEEKTDYGLPFLKVESNLSFASIAAASSSQSGFGSAPKTTSVVWGGVITPVFGSASKTTGAAGEGSDGEGDEEGTVETHDPHYEPIVPLPALINVRTGEEEETKVFGDRSKLYRFDSNTKEWKERGVGELKILFHPINHTYRFLMRRELVHKLVLNHQITADFDLKEMKNSDKSYVWYATNHAEDSPELEQLCVKFKNQDLARQFAEVVRRCVDDIVAYQASKSLQDTSGEECDVSQSTKQTEEEEEDEEYDEEGEDDDDEYEEVDDEELERRTIFEKRGKMDVREGDEWKTLGTGDIKVIYEPEFLGTILTLEVNGLVKCNALITSRSSIKAKEKSCECFADDLSLEETLTRKYRVKLSSNLSALEFESAFKQGVSIALEPQIEEDH